MPISLIQGGNADLAQVEMSPPMRVHLNWRFPEDSPTVTVDASVFLLNSDGVVRSDRDWVCYYQAHDINGAVARKPSGSPDQDCFQVSLSSIPDDVQRLVFGLTLEVTTTTPAFNAVADIHVLISDPATGAILIDHHSNSQLGTENGLMVAELYREAHGWAFRSIDQGFTGRLAALAAHFGVRMAPEELPQGQAVMDKGPVQPVSGQHHDCACRTKWMMSKPGMTGCELLVSLWQDKMALNPKSIMIHLLNEDPIHKVRMMLRRKHGCPMATPEIQQTIKRELLR